jgi:hypothetical protein
MVVFSDDKFEPGGREFVSFRRTKLEAVSSKRICSNAMGLTAFGGESVSPTPTYACLCGDDPMIADLVMARQHPR